MEEKKGILVVLSGGQDSATCLAMAMEYGRPIHTVSFAYGQKHSVELNCAEFLSSKAGAIHHIVPIDSFERVAVSSLIHDGEINQPHPINNKLPASFVPGRNLIFLTLAAALAYGLGIREIWTGVCETDFSGYPDCREETIRSLRKTINLGFGMYDDLEWNEDNLFKIVTPLMRMTKAETVKMMDQLGKLDWYRNTHTCYNGKYPPCGECPACKLRAKGFEQGGIKDPLVP